MKKKFLNYSIKLIKKYNQNYDEIKMAEIKYGLEGLYLTISKTSVIVLLALLLGIVNEMLMLLIFFNIVRTTGFGMHASKSWICLVTSIIGFIGMPLILKNITLLPVIKIILCILLITTFYLYAPADTAKRPIIKKRKRQIYRFITLFNSLILSLIAIFIKNEIIANFIICGLMMEAILIHPFTYKIFNHSYANYKTYKLHST